MGIFITKNGLDLSVFGEKMRENIIRKFKRKVRDCEYSILRLSLVEEDKRTSKIEAFHQQKLHGSFPTRFEGDAITISIRRGLHALNVS